MKKIGDSFKGIFGGFIFIIIGIILLWWNEGNNVKNIKTTQEMGKNYIQIGSETIDNNNEGKLVATNGKLIYEEELKDTVFNVSIIAPYLERIVEVYQWEEEEHSDDDGTTYEYKKVWSDELIDSSHFHKGGYENVTVKPYENNMVISSDVKLGAFKLPNDMITGLKANKNITSFDESVITSLDYKVSSIYITNSADLNKPEIGDIRISFVYPDYTEASVIATQSSSTFSPFVSSSGKTISRIEDGIHTGEELIKNIENENKLIKWMLRLFGFVAIFAGFSTILKPLSTITGFVPILGGLVNSAVGLIAFILGLIISLIVIAIAWIAFRPIIGISLLIVVGALIFFLIKKKNNGQINTSNTNVTNVDAMAQINTNTQNNNQENQTNISNDIQDNNQNQ